MALKGFLTSGVGSDKFPLLTLLSAAGPEINPPAYVYMQESSVGVGFAQMTQAVTGSTGYVYLSESLQ